MSTRIVPVEFTSAALGSDGGVKSDVITLNTGEWRGYIQHIVIIPTTGVGGDSFSFDLREVNDFTDANVYKSVASGSGYALTNNTQVVSRTGATEVLAFDTADLAKAGKSGLLYLKITVTDSVSPATTDYVFTGFLKIGRDT